MNFAELIRDGAGTSDNFKCFFLYIFLLNRVYAFINDSLLAEKWKDGSDLPTNFFLPSDLKSLVPKCGTPQWLFHIELDKREQL